MIAIDLTYIIVAAAALSLGFWLGKIWGRRHGHMDVLRIGLEVKNPEMWELLHFLVIEENEKTRARAEEREAKRTAALERKTAASRGDGDATTTTTTTTKKYRHRSS